MSPRITVMLAFTFMVLATIAFFDPFGWKRAKEERSEAERLVFSLRDEKISAVSIRHKDKQVKLECRKQGGCAFDYTGEWQMVQPIQDEGDSSNIGSMLSGLKNLAPVSRMEAGKAEWGDFGLTNPDPQLELQLTNGKSLSLGFGGESAIGANRYLRTNTNDKEVFLVATFFPDQLKNDLFHWRNKRIIRGVETESVERFAWNAGIAVEAKRDVSDWQLTKPYLARGNKVMIEGLLNTVLYANGKKILSESGVLPAGANKAVSVNLRLKDGKSLSAEIFTGPKRDAVMRVSGSKVIYSVDGIPFERFKKKPEEFRFLRFMSFEEKNAVTEVKLRFPREKQEIVLQKKGNDWERVGGVVPREPLSQTRLKDFLDTLAGQDAERFTRDPAKWKKFQSPADLEITFGKRTIRFVLDGRNSVLANGDFSGEARIMGGSFLKTLPVRLTDLYESRNKPVVTTEPEEHGDKHDQHNH